MRKGLIAAAAALAVVVVAGVGGYVYFFSNLRSSPGEPRLDREPGSKPNRERRGVRPGWNLDGDHGLSSALSRKGAFRG